MEQGSMPDERRPFSWTPSRLVIAYAAFSLIYFFFSDIAIDSLVEGNRLSASRRS